MERSRATAVSLRELNRWTLARQLLLAREQCAAVTGIERLAGMQAQYTPSPYIGLWSRLRDFARAELESAFLADQVIKATLMRGTLHVVSARDFPIYRLGVPTPIEAYPQSTKMLQQLGVDIELVRQEFRDAVRSGPRPKTELVAVLARHLPADSPAAYGMTMISGAELIHGGETARFGFFGTPILRAPPPPLVVDRAAALRHVVRAYLAAFGPATRADLAQWSGYNVAVYSDTIASCDLIEDRGEDGRAYLDLADAPRPDAGINAPVRFLPKWDNLLLGHARRERVLPEAFRTTVIRKNGDVLPTFLVDGMVAGTWEAPLKKAAIITLSPLLSLGRIQRTAVEEEAERLVAWLRPEMSKMDVRWDV
ncbi:MAG: winged helix DNA-binding domain-containing protein [Candidatus Dormibacteria bacterium]